MRTLLVPYIFFVIVTICCNGFLSITHGNVYPIFEIIKLYVVQNRYTLLWFIPCLFLANMFMYGLQILHLKINIKYFWLISSCINIILFGIYKVVIAKDLIWNADLSILATSFMCLGKWFRDGNFIEKIRVKKKSIVICIILTFVVSGVNYYYFDTVDLYNNAFGNPILFIVAAVSGTLSVILISKAIRKRVLVELGKNSLIYYGLHRIIIDLMFIVYEKIGISIDNTSWKAVGFAIVSVCVAIVVLKLVRCVVMKYVPWCLGKGKIGYD